MHEQFHLSVYIISILLVNRLRLCRSRWFDLYAMKKKVDGAALTIDRLVHIKISSIARFPISTTPCELKFSLRKLFFRETRITFPNKFTSYREVDTEQKRVVLLFLEWTNVSNPRAATSTDFFEPLSCICSSDDVIHDVQSNKCVLSANSRWCSLCSSVQIGTCWRNSITLPSSP